MAIHKILTLTWGVSEPSDLIRSLYQLGWEPVWVTDAATAQQALRQHTVQAGAFLLGNPSGTTGVAKESETSELVAFIQSVQDVQPLEWIALCDSSSMDLPQMRNLLIERFFDYYACPPDWAEVAGILNYLARRWELHRNLKTSAPVGMGPELLGMVGRSPAMERLRKTIRKVAQTQATVLIRGESGCGKELATRAIHLCSSRADGPFIAVNCASIPPSLMQSELFGYEKGSFTGAATRKQGLIEAAHQGTLFLDEIGDLSLDLQANLLRFLQEKSIYRVGGLQSIPLDTRVIAATHVNLQEAVLQGRFREDLFYRLNVLPIEVPALRERRMDIPLLAQHFFDRCKKEHTGQPQGFAHSAMNALTNYDWPGNVRELYNRVQRALVMAEGRWITAEDLGLESFLKKPSIRLESARTLAEREIIQLTLTEVGHNVSKAARELGISRMTLYRLMAKHDLLQ